jgi:uncharacterized protein involved in outer membrane biogenesis
LQTTLLGLALALIAAILAAFAAPLFIDWNEWRPELEAQASALAGTRVSIAGSIDLTLLPTPAFVLRDVSLGDASSGSGMRAAEMRGSLALTALLSGKIEADAFVVSRPAIRLVIEKDGSLLLPTGATAGQEISVSGFVLEAGSLTIEDRRTNSLLAADDFSARGELVSREGPFRLDGGFRLNGMRWIVRASSGRFGADHAGKVRLTLEHASDGISFDAEGLLALTNARPRFEGKVIAAQRSGRLPWRITSDVTGDASEIRFANLEVALGQGELPITLSGEAKLAPHANGTLEAALSSKRIDLDLGDQKAASTGAANVLPLLSDVRRTLGSLPMPARIAVSADGILAGGQLMRDVRASFNVNRGAVVPERIEARLPGRAVVSLAGKSEKQKFSGPLAFEAEDAQSFARWLLGEEVAGKLTLPPRLNMQAMLHAALDEEDYALRDLRANFGGTNVTGSVRRYIFSHPNWITEVNLTARDIDLDGVLPAARAVSALTNEELRANLTVTNARFMQKPVRRVAAELRRQPNENIKLSSLVVEDFEGVSLQAKHSKNEEIEFAAEATQVSGLNAAISYLSGSSDFGNIAAKYLTSHLPLRLTGTFSPQKSGWRAFVKSGDAALTFDLGERRDARQPVEILLRLPETEIAAKGEFRFGAEGRFEPVLALHFKSADLRKAFVLADRAAANVLPASGTANLARDGNNIVFDKLVIEIAGARGTGRIALPAGEVSPFSGALSFDKADANALLSLALGRANVSYTELGVPLLANFPGMLKVEIASLALSERIALQNAAFQIRAGRFETVFDEFRAQLAGGKLSGSLRVADTIPRVLEINLSAEDVALAQLLNTKALRGALRTTVSLGANGSTEDDLLASISGRGTIVLSNLEIDRTDATAVSSVFASLKDAPEEKTVEQALLVALERASLKISKLEAPLVFANGTVRSASAKAQAGNIEISLSGSLNIPKRIAEALLNIDVDVKSSVRPGATVRWSGSFEAPERKVEAKALITAITLRAIERGAQNPSNINIPQEDRAPLVKKKKAPAKSDIETAPLLPPPANVPSAPQPRSQN